MPKASARPTPGIEFKATLNGAEPSIWRVIRVPARLTLAQLHRVLQAAFGWTDSHLHEFEIGKLRFGPPGGDDWGNGQKAIDDRRVRLEELNLRRGAKVNYLYDFGDDWEVELKTIKLIDALSAAECVEGERAGPPDDSGGVCRYAELVEAISNPMHPEHEELVDWIGPDWNPELFDIGAINRELRRIR